MEAAVFVEESTKNKIWKASKNKSSKTSTKEFSSEEPWWKFNNRTHSTSCKSEKSMEKSFFWKRLKDGKKINKFKPKSKTYPESLTPWNYQPTKTHWKRKLPIFKSWNQWLQQKRFETTSSRKLSLNKTVTLWKLSLKTTFWSCKISSWK